MRIQSPVADLTVQDIHDISRGLDTSLKNMQKGATLGRTYLGHFDAVEQVTGNDGLVHTGARGAVWHCLWSVFPILQRRMPLQVASYLREMEQLFAGETFLKEHPHLKDSKEFYHRIQEAKVKSACCKLNMLVR